MTENYKYEVAFSFLQQDEAIVLELNNLISEKLSTFVYSEKQTELAGADGEKVFNETFSKDARIVVVLYRDEWGKTKWTRIEETAIRNRGYEEGYDFLFVINLDIASTLPKWLPKIYIWHNFERFKAENAAAIIEHKVTEKGGALKKETIKELAERTQRLRIAEKDRQSFLQSQDAVTAAVNEIEYIARKVQSIKGEIDQTVEHPFMVRLDGYLRIAGGFYDTACYGLVDRSLISVLFDNDIPFHGKFGRGMLTASISQLPELYTDREEKIIENEELRFDRDIYGKNGWSEYATGENFITTDELINKWMKKFFKAISAR